MFDEERTFTLPPNAQTRNYMVHFGCRQARDCINNSTRNLKSEMIIKLIFQMGCILKPECNFLNRYFRCLLPLETVDVEVKIKMMRGIHTFRRDRTTQVIKCNPWITRLCPYPSLIQKMKTYLELDDKLGPKPRCQNQTQSQ